MPNQYTSREPDSVARFWSKVDKSGGDDDCWPWRGTRNREHYGRVYCGKRRVAAHRIAYLLAIGPVPDGLFVCHACDNPPCCNPRHLWTGDAAANVADRVTKGRSASGDRSGTRLHPEVLSRGDDHWSRRTPGRLARGEQNGYAKLSVTDVQAIRERHAAGTSAKALGRVFGVADVTILSICKNKTWRHVPAVDATGLVDDVPG